MSYAAYKAFLKKGEPQNTCLESKKNLTHPNLQPMLIAVNLFIQPNRMNYNEYLFYFQLGTVLQSFRTCVILTLWK